MAVLGLAICLWGVPAPPQAAAAVVAVGAEGFITRMATAATASIPSSLARWAAMALEVKFVFGGSHNARARN